MMSKTYDELSKRWNFLKFQDISPVTDEQITARLSAIIAIEEELKSRWNQDETL